MVKVNTSNQTVQYTMACGKTIIQTATARKPRPTAPPTAENGSTAKNTATVNTRGRMARHMRDSGPMMREMGGGGMCLVMGGCMREVGKMGSRMGRVKDSMLMGMFLRGCGQMGNRMGRVSILVKRGMFIWECGSAGCRVGMGRVFMRMEMCMRGCFRRVI